MDRANLTMYVVYVNDEDHKGYLNDKLEVTNKLENAWFFTSKEDVMAKLKDYPYKYNMKETIITMRVAN